MGDINTDQLETDVRDVLKDTDVPELQPNYLQDQVSDATSDITDAGKKIATDPNKSDEIIDDLSTKLKDRATKISDSVDEDAISNAVAKNTDLNQQEAQEATQNIVNGLQKLLMKHNNKLKQHSKILNKQNKISIKQSKMRVKS